MNQLRITAAKSYDLMDAIFGPRSVIEKEEIEGKTTITDEDVEGQGAYFDEEIKELAGTEVPILIDGSLSQVDLPKEQQDILLLLPGKKLPCVVQIEPMEDFKTYRISLKR